MTNSQTLQEPVPSSNIAESDTARSDTSQAVALPTPPQPQSYTDFLKQDFAQLFDLLDTLEPHQQKFLRSRWLDQVLYMEKKAGQCRDRYYRLRLTTIVGGVVTPIMVSLNTGVVNDVLKMLLSAGTIVLGGLVAASAAIDEFFHYGERWSHYRRSAESLKSIGWQFSQLSGPYRRFKTHREGFLMFAEQIEEIIQQDVEQFSIQQAAQNQQEDEQLKSQEKPSPMV